VDALCLYARYTAASIKGQMQYPASFVLLSIGQFLSTIIEFIGIWALFSRFQALGGWTLPQVALFYGAVNIAFALADIISRGFDVFGPLFVKTGDFDRLLLRPRATLLQLLGYELRLTRVGRLLQGALVLGIAVGLLELSWGLGEVALLLSAVAGGVAFFVGLVILQATLAFWTVESLEVANTLTYGGVYAAQYPIEIYSRWFREFFTFVFPLSCIAYFPIVGVLGISDPLGAPAWFLYVSPLAGCLFLGASLIIWRLGERHYTSTGS
jgi:viologen exporter family transport system permease protein